MVEQWFTRCHFCRERIELKERKDFESFTHREAMEHIEGKEECRIAFRDWQEREEISFGMPYEPLWSVTEIEPDTLAWEESERQLEIQRRRGG